MTDPNRPRPGSMPGAEPPKVGNLGPVSTFAPSEFAKVIQGAGLWFRWQRAVECPCKLVGSNQTKPDCARCSGGGFWYVNPDIGRKRQSGALAYLDVQCTFGAQGVSVGWDNHSHEWGRFDSGRGVMTMQHELRVGYRDRFIGIQQVMSRSEIVVRGESREVPVGKGGRPNAEKLTALRYPPVRINFAADDNRLYYEGHDFRILEATQDKPQRLKWLPDKGPEVGAPYVVHYDCHPVWLVEDGMYAVQGLQGPESGLAGAFEARLLPTSFVVMLEFLVDGMGA